MAVEGWVEMKGTRLAQVMQYCNQRDTVNLIAYLTKPITVS